MSNVKRPKVNRKREKQMRYLSQAIQLEEAVNPHIIRATMSMVSLAIVIFLVWAGFTNINEVARTPGEVVPRGHQQIIQHFEGGIVSFVEHINTKKNPLFKDMSDVELCLRFFAYRQIDSWLGSTMEVFLDEYLKKATTPCGLASTSW